jgi:hypothetical protein
MLLPELANRGGFVVEVVQRLAVKYASRRIGRAPDDVESPVIQPRVQQ